MASRSLIGLDIGSRFIKAVELTESRGGLALTGWARAEVSEPQALPDILSGIVSRSGWKGKRVATSVSGRNVIVRYISAKRAPDAELAANLKYEVGKYLPFEPEMGYLDWERLEEPGGAIAEAPGGQGGEVRILLAAARRDAVDEHVALLERAGLKPSIVDVDAFALGNAFELRAMASPSMAEKTAALLDVGALKTSLTIMKPFSSYFFTREIYVAGNDFTGEIGRALGTDADSAEQAKRLQIDRVDEMKLAVATLLEDLCHEVRLSFDYFESQYERPVEGIWLSGGASTTPGLAEAFQTAFGKAPSKWDPTEGLPLVGEVNSSDLKGAAAQAAIAVGLASRVRED
ncbi:MAG: pilus assembly protein PilM [Planctomycetes bacterium]|nr:pilus assembly protein PilM [Planctomycetota bacterium]